MHHSLRLFLSLAIAATFAPAVAHQSVTTSNDDQDAVSVTIYNNNFGLVNDQRTVTLPRGISTLDYQGVSASIQPQTVMLNAADISLLEQNFEYDVLTPSVLLDKFIGKTVTLEHKKDDDIIREKATVLSNNNGVVLKVGDDIRVGHFSHDIIFDDVPKDLRDKPTLSMLIDNTVAGERQLGLSYLTNNLDWHADYVLTLNDDTLADIKGWVTLVNNTGTTFADASVQLMAGDVNRVYERNGPELYQAKMMVAARSQPTMQEEGLFEYHLYTLGHKTTLKNKQQKQVSLLEAQGITYEKRLLIDAPSYEVYQVKSRPTAQKIGAYATLFITNDQKNNLGMPLPAGVVRTYQHDSRGILQFIGEQRIEHTADQQEVAITIGKAFDISAKRELSHHVNRMRTEKKGATDERQRVTTSHYNVVISNAKDRDEVVYYQEHFSGTWRIVDETLPSEKSESHRNVWRVTVPAKGNVELKFSVEEIVAVE